MATTEQKTLVANTLIDLAQRVKRSTAADFVVWLNGQTTEWKRTYAAALIATDVQVAFDAILRIRYDYASAPTAAAATGSGSPDFGTEPDSPPSDGENGRTGSPHLDAERMGFAVEFAGSSS